MEKTKNSNLSKAKAAKNDEFYTQYADIEKEMNAYLDYDPEAFRGKTILMPCDDPEWSNFTRYFAQNFVRLGIKKLVSTSYAATSKQMTLEFQPSEYERSSPCFDPDKTSTHGKIFTLTEDLTRDGKIDIDDLSWSYLEGDGDFRSDEVKALRDEADMIITNPPFSLFREFLAWIIEANKRFVIVANKSCVTYKEVFPLIKDNRAWSGRTEWSGGMWFETKNSDDVDRVITGVDMKNVPSIWLTNIEHGRRHQPLQLMSMEDNLRFNKKMKGKAAYDRYDNYDAIEVPFTDAIPKDYDGAMGVPISFLDKYCPEQFEILGTSDNGLVDAEFKSTNGLTKEFVEDYYKAGGTGAYKEGNPTAGYYNNNVATMAYKRIFIRNKWGQV